MKLLSFFRNKRGKNILESFLPLYLENGEENRAMIAVVCALDKKIINISDVYNSNDYNF